MSGRSPLRRSWAVCGLALLVTATAVFGQGEYMIAFSAPSSVTGEPGSTVEFDVIVQLTQAALAVQGWQLGLTTDNPALYPIVGWTYSGSVAASTTDDPPGLRDKGFARTELTTGADNEGLVSAIVLSYFKDVTLEPEAVPYNLLCAKV
ncbi:MAG: hypothetical protein JSW47_13775, partial [Phycisphaerales bacterium]